MTLHSRSSVASRACDACKRRKVKCDSAGPCSNCRISNLDCQFTVRPKKRGRKFANVNNQTRELSLGEALPESQPSRCQTHPDVSPPQDTPVSHQGDLDHGEQLELSPACVIPNVTSPDHAGENPQIQSARIIWETLMEAIATEVPHLPIINIANCCIDLFMQYTFPTAPIVHEPKLRKDASILFSEPLPSSEASFFAIHEEDIIKKKRAFALVTALCASVSSVMPKSLLPYGHRVATPFLRASRDMLKSYDEYDLEYPDSSSLSIRDLHYTALQHTTGKRGAAYHIMGEATLLAQTLHLYDEQSIIRSDPVESQLLRSIFWHLYLSDKASVCLRSRPSVLDERLFYGKLTLRPDAEPFTSLLDTDNPSYSKPFEERLRVGFHLVAGLWSSASRIILQMQDFDITNNNRETSIKRLTESCINFSGMIDSLPSWLQVCNLVPGCQDEDTASPHNKTFWVQRCTLTMTFHCLRLVILQQAVEVGLTEVLGLSNQPFFLSLKKAEIIQDFIHTMEDIPFIYHQVKGEPSVERIRWVGTILLEMVQNVDEAMKPRVNSYFSRLLDLLAKLNSKASEELSS
ncbi:hypothetical protein BGZ63DRAFT_417339 [Mariannaea sp. PMI_226]|nr:hypothetical protein BGZ63DRAFT_417339 [Mariannaea sp. PMI_226]